MELSVTGEQQRHLLATIPLTNPLYGKTGVYHPEHVDFKSYLIFSNVHETYLSLPSPLLSSPSTDTAASSSSGLFVQSLKVTFQLYEHYKLSCELVSLATCYIILFRNR